MRPRYSASSRKKIIKQFHASGMTQTQFARENDLKLGTFHNWLAKHRETKTVNTPRVKTPPQFVEVTAAPKPTPVAAVEPDRVALRMRIGDDVVVEFATMPSPAYVVAIAQAANRGASC